MDKTAQAKTKTKPAAAGPIGVVLVTHTDFGAALLRAAEFILGPRDNCRSVTVDVSQEVDATVAALSRAIKETDGGGGVLVLTDMFGGTPSNLSLSLLGSHPLEVLTGVNLPMLIKALSPSDQPLAKIAADAKIAGCQGIVLAGEVLRGKTSEG
ncbi:MAG: PTS sugar transporter subunit IIA [Desulfovibrionaceae bacterium]|nr:PTS sugar transporter subunit IIA [Desulfovibrionaceae bacterium]